MPLPVAVDGEAVPCSLFDEPQLAALSREQQRQAGLQRAAALTHALAHGALPSLDTLEGDDAGLLLVRGFSTSTSRVEEARTSADGSATKLLIRLHDGLAVEAVILRHDSGAGRYGDGPRPSAKRTTLCLSSQVGCAMGCTFCATGTMGLVRNMSAGEIVEQAAHAFAVGRGPLRNAVFMGMGEPLNNYAAVVAAVRTLTASRSRGGFGLAASRVTISTVGVVPRIRTLAADLPGVRLALSLHAPDQAVRQSLVPSASSWPLEKLMEAACAYEAASHHAPLVEYVLLAGVNDSLAHAQQLGMLLCGRAWTVNLIPYNQTPGAPFKAPRAEQVDAFQRALRGEHGINTTVRRALGRDLEGACGQLVVASRDIEDL
jgi:adenine C2-methylase RlmN of 23S rRNA A2503 and tRNA A37